MAVHKLANVMPIETASVKELKFRMLRQFSFIVAKKKMKNLMQSVLAAASKFVTYVFPANRGRTGKKDNKSSTRLMCKHYKRLLLFIIASEKCGRELN